jgi:hypothetical protein
MSNLSAKQRDALPDSAFCDPKNRDFPIIDAADVTSAAHLIGKADDPAAVKACVIRKAKARGWPLPKAWESE